MINNQIANKILTFEGIIFSIMNSIGELKDFLTKNSILIEDITDDEVLITLLSDSYDIDSKLNELLMSYQSSLIEIENETEEELEEDQEE